MASLLWDEIASSYVHYLQFKLPDQSYRYLQAQGSWLVLDVSLPKKADGSIDFSYGVVIDKQSIGDKYFDLRYVEGGTSVIRNTSGTEVVDKLYSTSHNIVVSGDYFNYSKTDSPANFMLLNDSSVQILDPRGSYRYIGLIGDKWAGKVEYQNSAKLTKVFSSFPRNSIIDNNNPYEQLSSYGPSRFARDVSTPSIYPKSSTIRPLNATEQMFVQSFATQWGACLNNCDLNRDGNIDKNELTQILVRANTPQQQATENVEKIFQVLDKDGNGVINYNDIMIYNANPNAGVNQTPQFQQPQQQPQYQQPQQQQLGLDPSIVAQLVSYNMMFEGSLIYKRGQMEEYYVRPNNQIYRQIIWLRDNMGGGKWIKNGW